MKILFINFMILLSALLPSVLPPASGFSPNLPDMNRSPVFLPGTHNDWDLDADNLVPEKEFLGGTTAYYGKTIAVIPDGEFKIVHGDWSYNWGSGYWITSYDTRWTIAFDGANALWKGSPDAYLHVNIQQPEDFYNASIPVGIMSLSAVPVSIGQVSEAGETFNSGLIAPGGQVILCTLSGVPSPEEIIYIRYTTDGWSTSHFLVMTGTGPERAATIPAYPVGTDISYYTMSTTVSFQAGNDLDNFPDLMTINYNTNSGNNFNYTICDDSDGDGQCNELDPEPDCSSNDTDDCGVCGGNNADMDCAGVCFGNSTTDCSGGCGGTASLDDCGVCSGGNTGLVPNADMDCDGACFGNAIEDCAGVCDGYSAVDDCDECVDPAHFNEAMDCDGVCDGVAALDDCGVCAGGNTGLIPNAGMDCAGVCYGSAVENECGCVGGSTDLEPDFCYGCTDPGAYNYDELATIDNGDCQYQPDLYLYFDNVNEQQHTMEVWVDVQYEVYGFQLVLTGVYLSDVFGGVGDYPGEQISFSPSTGVILCFVFDLYGWPPGNYLLFNAAYSEILESQACLIETDFAGGPGSPQFNVITECYTFLNIEGCTDPVAVNYNPDAALDDGSCEYNIPGDITQDGQVDVVDVVFMVNVILEEIPLPEAQMTAGDLYQDEVITILDLVWLINIILGNGLTAQAPLTATILTVSEHEISVDAPAGIAAMQFDFEGDFSITHTFFPEGWQYRKNDTRLVLFSMDGSSLTQSAIFGYTGSIKMKSAIAADRTLNQKQLTIHSKSQQTASVEVYPNPFNPDLSVRYYLDIPFPVQIWIYDVSGRLVEELSPQENLRSPGWHHVRWSGADFPGGIYIMKLILPEGMVSQKLVLLK